MKVEEVVVGQSIYAWKFLFRGRNFNILLLGSPCPRVIDEPVWKDKLNYFLNLIKNINNKECKGENKIKKFRILDWRHCRKF